MTSGQNLNFSLRHSHVIMDHVAFLSLRTLLASAIALAATTGGTLAIAASSIGTPTHELAAVPAAATTSTDASGETREAEEYSRTEPRVDPAVAAAAQASLAKRQAALTNTATAITQKDAATKKAAAEKKAAEDKFIAENGFPSSLKDPKEIARAMAKHKYGWSDADFACYNNIIMRESMWDPYADNPTSSAYGIPQALPGKRMAKFGADWRTNPVTQIKWGLDYIEERYGSPCNGWAFKRAHGWY